MNDLNEILEDTVAYIRWLKESGERTAEVDAQTLASLSEKVETVQTPSVTPSQEAPRVQGTPTESPTANSKPDKEVRTSGEVEMTATTEPIQSSELVEIAKVISHCTACDLHKNRTQTVPGKGNPSPEVLFIGEAPGRDEDIAGEPFVGRAGQLLTKMIEAMGYSRDEVFIANINKCRPPNNRKPTRQEMDTCIPFLKQQIAILKPKVIIAMGATAVEGLQKLNEGEKISKIRGKWRTFEDIPLMPTYHPAYLLRNPAMKKPVWEDLQEVLRKLGRPIPTKSGGSSKQ